MARLVVLALAAWRLASMLVDEDGPGGVFVRLRQAAGLKQAPVKTPAGWTMAQTVSGPLAEALTCVWCLSVWTAAALNLRPLAWLRFPLAGSALAILLHEVLQWLRWRKE